MSKKLISLLLAVMLVVSMLIVAVASVSATDNIYTIQSNIGGDSSQEVLMTEQENGTYIKLFPDVPAGSYNFKIVENGITNITDAYNHRFQFRVSSPCDVVITYNPATGKVDFLGDSVTQPGNLEINHISVVGNGNGNWLNGLSWDFDWLKTIFRNSLEQITDNIYSITYYNVEPSDDYRFEFVVNGSWSNSWGLSPEGEVPEYGKAFDIDYNGDNIILDTKKFGYELSDVTLTVDLSEFDYSTKNGAKLTVDVEEASNPITTGLTDPSGSTYASESTSATDSSATVSSSGATEPSSSIQATTSEPVTTMEPNADVLNLTVNATSNYFPETSARYNPNTKEVTVTFAIKASKNLLDTQWYMTYDPKILQVSEKNTLDLVCPAVGATGASIGFNENEDGVGYVRYSASNLKLFDISSKMTTFASVIFDVKDISKKAPVSTTVDLVVSVLRAAQLSQESGLADPETETLIIDNEVVHYGTQSVKTQMTTTLTPTTYVEPTTAEPTEATADEAGLSSSQSDTTQESATQPQSSSDYTVDNAESTADTPDGESTAAIVNTGSPSSAAIILVLMISATVILFVLLKREMY